MKIKKVYDGNTTISNEISITEDVNFFIDLSQFKVSIDIKEDKKAQLQIIEVFYYNDEDGGFYAEVPSLPGCITQAETLEDLEENILDAIESYLESYDEDKEKPPYEFGKYAIKLNPK